jgi:hypothetical protein
MSVRFPCFFEITLRAKGVEPSHYNRLFTFSPISAGLAQTVIPACAIAFILSSALPEPPEMIAPA